jgi:CheY-like chemotaxis protein
MGEMPMAAPRILIVEDETMIAMMVEDFLMDLGWNVMGLAGTLDRALAMARDADIDAALLDVNLNGQDSFAAAEILSNRHIPFVFTTGYGSDGLSDRYRGVPTLTKPYQRDDLERALRQAMAGTGKCSKAASPRSHDVARQPAASAAPHGHSA